MSTKHRKKKDKKEGEEGEEEEEEKELQNVARVIECSFSPPPGRLLVPRGAQRERLHASSGDEPRSIHIGDIMAKRKQLKQLEKEQKKQQRFGSAAAAAAAAATSSDDSSTPLSLGSMSPSELLRLSEMIEQGDDYRSPFHSSQGSLSPRQPIGFGAYARSESDSSPRLGRSPHHTPSSPEYEAISPKSMSPKPKRKGYGKGGVGGGIYRRTKSKRKMRSTFSKKRCTKGKRRHSRRSRRSRHSRK
jgi:hypothetical protein